MVEIRTGAGNGPTQEIRLQADKAGLDFERAKELAKRTACGISAEAMLLSWHNADTGDYYPAVECGRSGRPAWVVYAEARGADLTIDINDGQYTFMFLKLAR